jgi:hypothetical protein
MRSVGVFGSRVFRSINQSRCIGIKIGKDIEIDVNDPDFFKVKQPPSRHLYPEMYHPKQKNSDNKPTVNIKISMSVSNVRTVNISLNVNVNDIPPKEN